MMVPTFSISLQTCLVFTVSLFYIYFAPFTKVEESFSIQAIHDYLFLSKPTLFVANLATRLNANFVISENTSSSSVWDHENFPGVVRRTFITSFIVYIFVKPIQLLNLIEDKFNYQVISRVVLSVLFAYSYHLSNKSIAKLNGIQNSQICTLLTVSQFHILFYSSRTLPNTFALIFVLLAYSAWFEQKWSKFILIISFTVLIVRFETIILFGFILLYEVFYSKKLDLVKVFVVGIPSGIVWILFSFLFDSYMWNKWIWPEGDGIVFNIIENKSHEWGTKPFFWYFYSVIPRLLLLSIGLLIADPKSLLNKFAFVSFAFIFVYSFLPHKELRFVIYAGPLLNVCIAGAFLNLLQFLNKFQSTFSSLESKNIVHSKSVPNYNLRKRIPFKNENNQTTKSIKSRSIESKSQGVWQSFQKCAVVLLKFALYFHFIVNILLSQILFYISSNNYPGGEAMFVVNNAIRNDHLDSLNRTSVYVSNLVAQTGFTRFLELDSVYYNKDSQFLADNFIDFDNIYLALETKEKYLDTCALDISLNVFRCQFVTNKSFSVDYQCRLLQTISSFDRINFKRFLINFDTFVNIFYCSKIIDPDI